MPITEIDKATCKDLQRDMLLALEFVASKYGVTVDAKGARFNPGRMTVSIEVSVINAATGNPKGFESDAIRIGLPADAYGWFFRSGGHEYRITGIKTRNRKYPVIAIRTSDDSSFKFPVSRVLPTLRREA